MFDITSKLEINVDDPRIPVPVVTEFAAKCHAAAIVIDDPALIQPYIQSRMSTNGKYKIILAVDFKKGTNYAMAKFRDYTTDVDITSVDGYDIRLTTTKAQNVPLNEVEVYNEIQVLKKFLGQIRSTFDVRFSIDIFSRPWDQVEYALKTIAKVPCNMIRLESHLAIHESKANIDLTKRAIESIRKYSPVPIKVSTNVDRAMIDALKGMAARFDVSMVGMQKIVASLEAVPTSSGVAKVVDKISPPVIAAPAQPKSTELGESKIDESVELKTTEPQLAVTATAPKVRELVKQRISAKKSPLTVDQNASAEMKVQRSLEVNTKPFTGAPRNLKKQSWSSSSVTPPPNNAKKQ